VPTLNVHVHAPDHAPQVLNSFLHAPTNMCVAAQWPPARYMTPFPTFSLTPLHLPPPPPPPLRTPTPAHLHLRLPHPPAPRLPVAVLQQLRQEAGVQLAGAARVGGRLHDGLQAVGVALAQLLVPAEVPPLSSRRGCRRFSPPPPALHAQAPGSPGPSRQCPPSGSAPMVLRPRRASPRLRSARAHHPRPRAQGPRSHLVHTLGRERAAPSLQSTPLMAGR